MTIRKYMIEGRRYDVEIVSRSGSEATVRVNGKSYRVRSGNDDPASRVPKRAAGATSRPVLPHMQGVASDVRAPIAGRVVGVHVKPGDRCVVGAPLVVLDAMKMENTLCAPRAGLVKEVAVRVGDTVLQGTLLVRLT